MPYSSEDEQIFNIDTHKKSEAICFRFQFLNYINYLTTRSVKPLIS